MRDNLWAMFTYLDLICIDCATHEQSVANSLAAMASQEFDLLHWGNVGDRVELRLKRVEEFITYLSRESDIERDMLSLSPKEVRYAEELKKRFATERQRVKSSAARYVNKALALQFSHPDE